MFLRLFLRLSVFALASYGAWMLYERYNDRVRAMQGPAEDFTRQAKDAVQAAAEEAQVAGELAADSVNRSGERIKRAARSSTEAAVHTWQATDNASEPRSAAGHSSESR